MPKLSAPPAASPRAKPFKLTRFHSVTSLVGIAVVTACLLWTYRALAERHLLDHESRANADQARAFANSVWSRYRDFVLAAAARSRAELLADPALPALDADVRAQMSGLQVAKIKIYDMRGLTVFSTDPRQIGEDKSDNRGFIDARDGNVVSQMVYREKFDAFEGEVSRRNLIASYVPVRQGGQGGVEGVIEVYSDVTALLAKQRQAQWQVGAIVLALLSMLYLFLFVAVRKADRIIARQEQDRAAKEAEVRHQAYHDALTGLPNRAYFGERLAEALGLAARHGGTCALMFIDLDRFKMVNDSLGHQAGDALLKVVSARIHHCLRGSDLLFRMGGDEFTVILPEVPTPEAPALVARRILEAVASPVTVHEHELVVGATIGIAVYPGDGETAETLLKNADAAMYAAKESGRGTHAFYRAAMNQRALERLDLEAAVQKGFRDGEFALYYQPRLDTRTRRIVAVEVLLRWLSPTRGLVLPGEFIGVLEETGMMTIVGEWVLRRACDQSRRWRDEGREPLRVSVNVSSVQFQSATFVAVVERVLRETGATPSSIELELTETVLIDNVQQARATIASLKRLGLRVSIDDFGTGYSSLNYLRHFAVDYVKIDRSFVTEIADNSRDRAVATAIVQLAKALDIAVVAEGVETNAQAAFFTGVHCGEMQGFLFSEPVPVERFERLLPPRASVDPAAGAPEGSHSEARLALP